MALDIIPRTLVVEIAANRNAAIHQMQEAARTMAEGLRLAGEAQKVAHDAHGMSTFPQRDYSGDAHYQQLFQAFDDVRAIDMYRKQLDARVWMHVLALSGMSDLMDRTAKEQLYRDLAGDVPEFSEESARQVFEGLLGDAQLIFQRGLARTFIDLDRRFKSHDGFKIGSRVILTHVFNDWGHFNHGHVRDTLADVERVFAILDGKTPDPGALARAIESDRKHGWNPRQSLTETPYFRVRCFQNGNAHLWFLRDDLVEKANQVLADYYGAVLPDAVPGDVTPDDLRTKSGLPSTNLSFYPTPDAVVTACLSDLYLREGKRVLEPSAGTGNMVAHILRTGASVDAIEIDAGRVAQLNLHKHPNLTVTRGNFLTTPATPEYDCVVMNPPFSGTHWMEHVMHAFDFLKPGGKLVAVLPATAEIGSSAKHVAFQEWALKHSRWGRAFTDLPAESFSESGTRVSTVLLTISK